MIIKCTCKHIGQDKLHGEAMRVFNPTSKDKTYKCTVCKKEITKGDSKVK